LRPGAPLAALAIRTLKIPALVRDHRILVYVAVSPFSLIR
jgi:hypothetical protein